MSQYNRLLEKIIKDLQSKVRCPVCNQGFVKEDILFKGSDNGQYKFEFSCPTCSTLLFAKVTVDKIANNNRVREDKNSFKLDQFSQASKYQAPKRKIKANDIIRLHKALESTDDISKIL